MLWQPVKSRLHSPNLNANFICGIPVHHAAVHTADKFDSAFEPDRDTARQDSDFRRGHFSDYKVPTGLYQVQVLPAKLFSIHLNVDIYCHVIHLRI